MPNIDKILEASNRVQSLRQQLKTAEEALSTLVGEGRLARAPQPSGRGVRQAPGPSISSRVLDMVVNSGRAGLARREIIAVIGKEHEAAAHSALKAHQAAGRIENDGGQWVATAPYVEQLQSAQRTTRQMHVPVLPAQ